MGIFCAFVRLTNRGITHFRICVAVAAILSRLLLNRRTTGTNYCSSGSILGFKSPPFVLIMYILRST
jgi:hypothetical protein